MTCKDSGKAIEDALFAWFDATGSYAPTIGGAAIRAVTARARGETPDTSYQGYGEATGIDGVFMMGVGQISGNAVARFAGDTAGAMSGEVVAASGDANTARKDVDTQIDKNPDGADGPCDPDPNPNPDPGHHGPNNPGYPGYPGYPIHPIPIPHLPGGPTGPGGDGTGRANGTGGGASNTTGSDPLVIDLNGDGVKLTSVTSSQVYFDFSGDGFSGKTGWVSPEDGILVLDRNGNGLIDNGSELFGSATQDGFDALRALDSNSDGVFNASDAQFLQVRVWQDSNGDGVSQTSTAATISSLPTSSRATPSRSIRMSTRVRAGSSTSPSWTARAGTMPICSRWRPRRPRRTTRSTAATIRTACPAGRATIRSSAWTATTLSAVEPATIC